MADDLGPRQRAAETKRKRTRAALLDAALVVFSDQGFKARMEDVAREAGVGVATAYTHFSTKIDLLLHAFSKVIEPFQERANEDVETKIDPILAITRHVTQFHHRLKTQYATLTATYLAAVADAASSGDKTYVLWFTASGAGHPEIHKYAKPIEPLWTLIHYGQQTGDLRSDIQSWQAASYYTYAMLWQIGVPSGTGIRDKALVDHTLKALFLLLKKEEG